MSHLSSLCFNHSCTIYTIHNLPINLNSGLYSVGQGVVFTQAYCEHYLCIQLETHRPDNEGWAGSPEVAISMTVIERQLIYLPPFFTLQQHKTKAKREA